MHKQPAPIFPKCRLLFPFGVLIRIAYFFGSDKKSLHIKSIIGLCTAFPKHCAADIGAGRKEDLLNNHVSFKLAGGHTKCRLLRVLIWTNSPKNNENIKIAKQILHEMSNKSKIQFLYV